MKLYFYGFLVLIKKYILKKNTGDCIRFFVEKMGIVYIKFAQMLAMQNCGNLFTEEDRQKLASICDHCNPISYKKIKKQLEKEYACPIEKKFKKVFSEPVGSASISQVHKAILKNGMVVAIKIKRKDVTKKIEKDIKQIKKIMHRFGKFVSFKNYLGGDASLELYLQWILEEADFKNEVQNIKRYYQFAQSVNGKIPNTKKIVVPKVYKKMCTENVIVMEYIFSPTITKISLTHENKKRIRSSLNDYVQLSFYALFHDLPVVFHGDPHGGNIYIEKSGNIGFLDMGLIFCFTKEESCFVRNLFLNAYLCNIDELTHLLVDGQKQKNIDIEALKRDMEVCCKQFKDIPVTAFFVNMIFVFTKYNIDPDKNLYKMAKAFVSLFGMNVFLDNEKSTEELLLKQVVSFYTDRTLNDMKEVVSSGISIFPNFIKESLKVGVFQSFSNQIVNLYGFHSKMKTALQHTDEIFQLLKK